MCRLQPGDQHCLVAADLVGEQVTVLLWLLHQGHLGLETRDMRYQKQICQKEQKFSNFLSGVVRKGSPIAKSERNIPTTQTNSCWEPSSFHISHFSFSLIFGMDSVLSKIIWKSYLIMTLLRSWHHLTALICTQLYRNLLTCSVTHMLPWRLLHVPGSAGCLVILATSLIS